MSDDYTTPLPAGELALPEPPEGHFWTVRNEITSTDTLSIYSIVINLVNPQGTKVVTVKEEWDTKVDDFVSFVLSVAGLALIQLRMYQNFISIDWSLDNPEFKKTVEKTSDDATSYLWHQ